MAGRLPAAGRRQAAAAALARRVAATTRLPVLGLALTLAGLAAVALRDSALAFAGAGAAPRGLSLAGPDTQAQARAGRVALRARPPVTQPRIARNSPYYSREDRVRLSRHRNETRFVLRERAAAGGPTAPTLNYDMLPSVADIYNRKYTGNASNDPIGGRKRYTYWVLVKKDPNSGDGKAALKVFILEYIAFMKEKMSCKDILGGTKVSPIDGKDLTTLEYPMKEYGALPRGMKQKPQYSQATLVKFTFAGPVQANDYIQKKIYSDNRVLRYMCIGHTRTFKHIGEDNELHL